MKENTAVVTTRPLWSGRHLQAGATYVLRGGDPLRNSIAARLKNLLEKAEAHSLPSSVPCPEFPIEPGIVAQFRQESTEAYWQKTMANRHAEQNARPLPAYLYMVRDWDAYAIPFNQIREAFSASMELTLAGLAFDREDLLDRALTIWREIVAWERGGLCDDWHGDTIATRMCLYLVRIAFWQSERLTDADWQALGSMLEWRMKDSFEFLCFFEIERFPLDSHIASAAAHFAATVLAAEKSFPSLKKYADWVRNSIEPIFPIWGGADGGWAAGVNYWRWSANSWLLMADLYEEGHPMSRHPWVLNSGWFKLYTHPPYSSQGAFGDHGDVPPLSLDAALMLYLGARHQVGDWVRYAEEYSQRPPHGCPDPGPVFSEVEALAMELAAMSILQERKPPLRQSLPGTQHFSDTGIVACHTHLGSKENDIMLLFRSSRWGSFNHAHADQNSFVLEAWGEPILIDSGYYPLYHHPHMKQFTIQTQAHNAVLVDGVGQTIRNLHAKGKITHFESNYQADRFTGDATEAYGGRCEKVLRHLWFEREADTPFIIVMDEVETVHPHTLNWLLHSYEPFEVDGERNTINARGWQKHGGTARARIHILTPSQLYWHQSGEFPVPADRREADKARQWHLTVTPKDAFTRSLLIAVIQVGRESSPWHVPEALFQERRWEVSVGEHHFVCSPGHGITRSTRPSPLHNIQSLEKPADRR